MRYVRIAGWSEEQSYKGSMPQWIRLYNELLDDYRWGRLSDAAKSHFVGLCLLASRTGNLIEADEEWIARRIQASEPVDIATLVELGFLERCEGGRKGLPGTVKTAPEKARKSDAEKAQEKPPEKAPGTRAPRKRKTVAKRKVAPRSKPAAKELLHALFSEENTERDLKRDREKESETKTPQPAKASQVETPAGSDPEPQPPCAPPPGVAAPASVPGPPAIPHRAGQTGLPPPPFATPGEPTQAELTAYAAAIGYGSFCPEAFLARYRAVGWRQGGERIADWRPLVHRWQLAERKGRGGGRATAFNVGRRLVAEAAGGGR